MLTLNASGPSTAVFRYAIRAHRAGGGGEFLNLDLGGRLDRWSFGTTVRGIRTRIYPIDMMANSLFPHAFLRGAGRAVIRARAAGEPVHCASLAVPLPAGAPGDLEFVTIHDSPESFLRPGVYADRAIYRSLQRRRLGQYRRFPQVLTGTRHVRDGLVRFGMDGQITVIPHPVSPTLGPSKVPATAVRRQLGLPTDKTLVLSVGTDEPRKNLGILPRVLEQLGSSFRLVRVGPPVDGSVTFQNVSDETLAALYSACNLLLFPSLEEGLGLPVAEAMTCGLPVVASDIEVLREVVGDAARLADPLSAPDLARAAREVVASPDEWVQRGYRQSRRYSYDEFRRAFEGFLGHLTSGEAGSERVGQRGSLM